LLLLLLLLLASLLPVLLLLLLLLLLLCLPDATSHGLRVIQVRPVSSNRNACAGECRGTQQCDITLQC
jgi:hypothetical protein